MVTSVQRYSPPRLGIAGARPLNVRFAEALAEADRALRTDDERTGIFNLMASEANIDLINNRITEVTNKRHVAEAPHPIVVQHLNECYALINRENDGYAALARKIAEAQPRLLALRSDWRHKKLGSRLLCANCFTILPQLNQDYFSPKWLKTTSESKAALDDVIVRLKEATRIWALISKALNFEKQPLDVQAMELMAAAVEDERVLKRRITALESEITALRAIVTKPKRKPKKVKT
jgi:hypothetical protein